MSSQCLSMRTGFGAAQAKSLIVRGCLYVAEGRQGDGILLCVLSSFSHITSTVMRLLYFFVSTLNCFAFNKDCDRVNGTN